MGIFHRMGNAIARFMYGRNGMDQLNKALFVGYLLLVVAQMVLLRSRATAVMGQMFDLLLPLGLILIFFRMLSRNVYKRQGENRKWVGIWSGIKGKWSSSRTRHADKDHKYFTCKGCQTVCRVPVGKGKVVITCPKCGAEIKGET